MQPASQSDRHVITAPAVRLSVAQQGGARRVIRTAPAYQPFSRHRESVRRTRPPASRSLELRHNSLSTLLHDATTPSQSVSPSRQRRQADIAAAGTNATVLEFPSWWLRTNHNAGPSLARRQLTCGRNMPTAQLTVFRDAAGKFLRNNEDGRFVGNPFSANHGHQPAICRGACAIRSISQSSYERPHSSDASGRTLGRVTGNKRQIRQTQLKIQSIRRKAWGTPILHSLRDIRYNPLRRSSARSPGCVYRPTTASCPRSSRRSSSGFCGGFTPLSPPNYTAVSDFALASIRWWIPIHPDAYYLARGGGEYFACNSHGRREHLLAPATSRGRGPSASFS